MAGIYLCNQICALYKCQRQFVLSTFRSVSIVLMPNVTSCLAVLIGPTCTLTLGDVYFFQHDFLSFPVAPSPSYVMSALFTLWQIAKRE